NQTGSLLPLREIARWPRKVLVSRFRTSPAEVAVRTAIPEGLDRKEAEVYARLDPKRLPKHIAIIMDGNGRWAKARHMPRITGHRAGVGAVGSTIETAARIGIPWLTLYAFSVENWQRRPRSETNFLMTL